MFRAKQGSEETMFSGQILQYELNGKDVGSV
jgi:hypothetical protein